MLVPTRWSLGFMKGTDNSHLAAGDNDSVVLSDDAFGHVGSGGSIGFADRPARAVVRLHDEPAGRTSGSTIERNR